MENKSENGKSNGRLSKDQWKEIRDKFLKYAGTITEFCSDNELTFSTVYKHSSKENWIKQREALRLQDLKSGKVPFDEKVESTMNLAMDKIKTELESKDFKAKNLPVVVNTVERIQAVKYRMLDIPLPKQPIEIEKKPDSPMESITKGLAEMGITVTNNPGASDGKDN